MAKTSGIPNSRQPMKANVAPGAVLGSQGDGYLNANAKAVAAAVTGKGGGNATAARDAIRNRQIFDEQG